ncbi:hypothetical protein BUALT_Bualt15G0139700 [Buddleja alternifolia]|uniref:Uncharacterized protein n=1 Tax=Buddleja alternifolia TaxID=168488 RepID=A0AAV6WLM7_9LAMI|nr:hypothetical protein BUALT_Bualt15G0139700 [Buddleja alternifolia]
MEEDGDDLTPFWIQSTTNHRPADRLRRRVSTFFSSGLVAFLLLLTAVFFLNQRRYYDDLHVDAVRVSDPRQLHHRRHRSLEEVEHWKAAPPPQIKTVVVDTLLSRSKEDLPPPEQPPEAAEASPESAEHSPAPPKPRRVHGSVDRKKERSKTQTKENDNRQTAPHPQPKPNPQIAQSTPHKLPKPIKIHTFDRLDENSNSGSESSLNRIPPPPPPPPPAFFKSPAWRFVVQGDYVRVNSSPEAEETESDVTPSAASDGGDATPFHPSGLG